MMHGYGWDHMGAWGWAGMLAMLLFWFGLVALLVWALSSGHGRRNVDPAGGFTRPDRSLIVLRERFAKGEITAEEYEYARGVLEHDDCKAV
jgi:putative membrane protein